DNVPEVRVLCSQVAGSEQVCARAGADKQPELACQAAHLADRRVAVHRDYLVDDVPVPGEDARNETVGDALDEVPANLAAHQGARLVGLDGYDPAAWVALAEALAHPHDRAAGADPADHRVRGHIVRQLGEGLRPEPGAVLL